MHGENRMRGYLDGNLYFHSTLLFFFKNSIYVFKSFANPINQVSVRKVNYNVLFQVYNLLSGVKI